MTYRESAKHIKALERIEKLPSANLLDWCALSEDELRKSLPADSRLLARFLAVSADIEKKLNGPEPPADGSDTAMERLRADANTVISYARESLASEPVSSDELKEEIDHAIQNGYFKSIYFRFIVSAAVVLFALITGVGAFRVNSVVQEMQQKLDEARKQVADGNAEITKMRAENSNRQAELALLILQGNADLVKMRTNAIDEMSKTTESFKTEMASKTKQWGDQADTSGSAAQKKIENAGESGQQAVTAKAKESVAALDKALISAKMRVEDKLGSVVADLGASQKPWVPAVLWSMSKAWLFIPACLLLSVFAFAGAAFHYWKTRRWLINAAITAGMVVIIFVFVVWRYV